MVFQVTVAMGPPERIIFDDTTIWADGSRRKILNIKALDGSRGTCVGSGELALVTGGELFSAAVAGHKHI